MKITGQTNKLIFVPMGMQYAERYDDDVCNFRVRTRFTNSKDDMFFIEFGQSRDKEKLRIDHAITNYSDISRTDQNNHKRLEIDYPDLKYTLQNLLKVVNTYFDCNFTKVEIGDIAQSTDDFYCKSPNYK